MAECVVTVRGNFVSFFMKAALNLLMRGSIAPPIKGFLRPEKTQKNTETRIPPRFAGFLCL